MKQQNIYRELHQSLEPTLPIWFKVFGFLAPDRTIHPVGGEGGDPGNPRAFVERRLQISSTQEQYFSRKATIVTALPPRIHWRCFQCISQKPSLGAPVKSYRKSYEICVYTNELSPMKSTCLAKKFACDDHDFIGQ